MHSGKGRETLGRVFVIVDVKSLRFWGGLRRDVLGVWVDLLQLYAAMFLASVGSFDLD